MARPKAYAHIGFTDSKGKLFTLIESDDPSANLYYVIPEGFNIGKTADGKPSVAVALCENLTVPSIDGTGVLQPFLNPDSLNEMKRQFGPNIVPLPMSTAGAVTILGGAGITQGISANDDPDNLIDENLLNGLPPEAQAKIKELYIKWKVWGVRPSLIDFFPQPDKGIGFQFPKNIGSNLSAGIPFAFAVRGKDDVARIKKLINQGGLLSGQVAYNYRGTVTPFRMTVFADIKKIHEHMNAHFTVGRWFWKADIYQEIEKLKEEGLIQVKIRDEAGTVVDRYNVTQILDKVLDKVIEAAFDKRPDITANRRLAEADAGRRWWWWSGGFAYKGSRAEFEKIFNFELLI